MENSVIGDPVHDTGHPVFTDTEADVPAGVVARVEVPAVLDVVERGAMQIGAAANDQRHGLGHMLQNIAAGFARRDVRPIGRIIRNALEEIGVVLLHGVIEFMREIFVRLAPSIEALVPIGTFRLEVFGMPGEVFADFGRDVEFFCGQAEPFPCRVGKLHAALAVCFARSRHLGDPFPDERFCHDQLRLASPRLRFVVSPQELLHVLPVHLLHVPPIGFITGDGVFALREQGHRVEGDIVRVVNEDEVVQLEVTGQRAGFARHTFLQATVAGEAHDLVIENTMLRRIEARFGHFAGNSQTNRIGHTLPERPRRCLYSRRLAEFRMSGRYAAELAKVFHLFEGNFEAREVQPAVEEHAAVTRRENKTIAVQPARLFGIVAESRSEKDRPDFGAAQRQTKMAGFAGGDGIDGKSTRIARGQGENFVGQAHE